MVHLSVYDPPISNLLPRRTISLKDFYNRLRYDGYLKKATKVYREEIPAMNKAGFKREAFGYATLSGVFIRRNDNDLMQYSGLVCIDCDNLAESELIMLKEFATNDPYTVLSFTSPSMGYKIVIRSSSIENHKIIFDTYRNYLSEQTGISIEKLDSSCRNISRACFMCHDDEAYINELVLQDEIEAIPIIDIDPIDHTTTTNPDRPVVSGIGEEVAVSYALDYDYKDLEANFMSLISFKEKKDGRYGSPREPWIHSLASLCNQFGMTEDRVIQLMVKHYAEHPESLRPDKPLDVKKGIIAPVQDVYKRYLHQHGEWVDRTMVSDEVVDTPYLADEMFASLPEFLKTIAGLYDDKRERDIVFLTVLVVLSSCFPNYSGVYDKNKVWSNLFLFIVAPPASGKGKIAAVRSLGDGLQKQLDDEYSAEYCRYLEDLKEYEQTPKEERTESAPIKPEMKKLFIPANNTASKIVQSMSRNRNFGVILDTEADTLTQSLKSEMGNFSDLLRKVAHHEAYELERKTNDEYIMISPTFLSLALAGTPNQVNSLIHNVENGLLSRILFYTYKSKRNFKADVFTRPETLPIDRFSAMSMDLLYFLNKIKAFDKVDDNTNDYEFDLNDRQKGFFINWFSKKEKQLIDIYGDDIAPSVYRLGLVAFRIAMILSIIRQMQRDNVAQAIICHDDDFNASISIVDCLSQHLIVVFKQLKSNLKRGVIKKPITLLYEKLPNNFSWNDAMDKADLLNIKRKTAEDYIRRYIQEGTLLKVKKSEYKKQ